MFRDYLLVIGDREPLAWILTEGRMAFPARRSRETSQLSEGDRLFLYTTRGCFRNPRRDRGRVIGEATVATTVSELENPVKFRGQVFSLGCSLVITGLALRPEGTEMTELIEDMHLFPSANPLSWGMRLRRVLVPLDKHDASLLHKKLARVMRPVADARIGYLANTRFALPANS